MSPPAEYRSSCHWAHETATCVPTYAEIFAPGSPSMRTFNAKAYAAALALEQQCGMQSSSVARGPQLQHGGGCRAPCHWSAAHSRCHIDLEDALRITLSCSGSQVHQQAACRFEGWDRLEWLDASADTTTTGAASASTGLPLASMTRRLLSGGGSGDEALTPCRKECSPIILAGSTINGGGRTTCAAGFFANLATKEERAEWSMSASQGEKGYSPGLKFEVTSQGDF